MTLSYLDALLAKQIDVDGVRMTPLRGALNLIAGSGITLAGADNPTTKVTDVTISASVVAAYATVEDEGTPVTARTVLNFTGAGVSVADTGGKTTVTITGGGAGSLTPPVNPTDDGKVALAQAGDLVYIDGGSAGEVLTWNGSEWLGSFLSVVTKPANPADDGKLAVASGGDLSYALLLNANVDAAAAIAGSKIAPQFGAQVVSTTSRVEIGATPATLGDIRLGSTASIYGTSTGPVNRVLLGWNANRIELGDASCAGATILGGGAAGTIALRLNAVTELTILQAEARLRHGASLTGRDNADANTRNLVSWGVVGTDTLTFGNDSVDVQYHANSDGHVFNVAGATSLVVGNEATILASGGIHTLYHSDGGSPVEVLGVSNATTLPLVAFFGQPGSWQSADGALFLADAAAEPTAVTAAGAFLWAFGSSELKTHQFAATTYVLAGSGTAPTAGEFRIASGGSLVARGSSINITAISTSGNGLLLGATNASSTTVQTANGAALTLQCGPAGTTGASLMVNIGSNARIRADNTGVGFNGQAPVARPDYTATNVTTQRTIDADTIDLPTLADVVGTLIADLIAVGIAQ